MTLRASTATFRLYDWGHVGFDGRPRKLHHAHALKAIKAEFVKDPRRETPLTPGPNPRILLLRCDFVQLELILVDRGDRVMPERKSVSFLTVSAGSGCIMSDAGRTELAIGDTVAIPAETDYAVMPGDRGIRLIRAIPRGLAKGRTA